MLASAVLTFAEHEENLALGDSMELHQLSRRSQWVHPLHHSEGARVTHVRGAILSVVKTVLVEQMSAATWEDYLWTLSRETREEFIKEISPYEWVPFGTILEAVRNLPSELREGQSLLKGGIYADRMLTEHHQWMLRVMTPELLVQQSPRILAFYVRGGEMMIKGQGPGHAIIGFRASGAPSSWFSTLIPAWFQRALELCGGKEIGVLHELPDPTEDRLLHRYCLRWS
jgi:hypothetical protein